MFIYIWEPLLDGMSALAAHVKIFSMKLSSSPKGSAHLIKFRCCISNNALPHQLVTIQDKVLKFETFVVIHIDFIKDFIYLLRFDLSEKANVMRTVQRKN